MKQKAWDLKGRNISATLITAVRYNDANKIPGHSYDPGCTIFILAEDTIIFILQNNVVYLLQATCCFKVDCDIKRKFESSESERKKRSIRQ
jgi:hypothetical protein